jgi:hypothetical protein
MSLWPSLRPEFFGLHGCFAQLSASRFGRRVGDGLGPSSSLDWLLCLRVWFMPRFFLPRSARVTGLLLMLAQGMAVAAAPELWCQMRLADQVAELHALPSPDPYAPSRVAFDERFSLSATVLGQGDDIGHITLTVHDLSQAGGPLPVHQLRLKPPFPQGQALPALTGWQHVYVGSLGRELQYGCALRPAVSTAMPAAIPTPPSAPTSASTQTTARTLTPSAAAPAAQAASPQGHRAHGLGRRRDAGRWPRSPGAPRW